MATPGNGPRPYCRSTFAPARKVSPGDTGTLLACTSELTIDPTTDSTNGSGSTLSSGAIAPSTSVARSSRPWHMRAWISPMRAAGSAIPTGAASITPPKRFPPAGSSSERRFTGTAIGRESIGIPNASFVIPAQRATAGQVRVVDGSLGCPGRCAEGSEVYVDRLAAGGQAAAAQQWGRLGGQPET